MAFCAAAWCAGFPQVDGGRTASKSTPTRPRSQRVRSGGSSFHSSARRSGDPHAYVGRTYELSHSDGGAQHPDRSGLERAGLSAPVHRPPTLGCPRSRVRPTAAHRCGRAVPRSLRPSRFRYDLASGRTISRRWLVLTIGDRRLFAAQGCSRSSGKGLVG
jgi:hypothetical protein